MQQQQQQKPIIIVLVNVCVHHQFLCMYVLVEQNA